MDILHLCSDYSGTPLYRDLVESLSKAGVHQTIYVPVRSEDLINKYRSYEMADAEYYYSYILNPFLRFNYFRKTKKVYNDIKLKLDLTKFKLVHAHFLFSDGGVAYKLKKQFDIDYIVTVRNTDIYVFYKYMVHLRGIGLKILSSAQKIIFLSPTYKNTLIDKFIPIEYKEKIESKSVIIPNGISDFWLKNLSEPRKINEKRISLIYVGEFSRNKNLAVVFKVIDILRNKGKEIDLTIIGQYGDNIRRISKLVEKRKLYIKSLPRIYEKAELLRYYRNADIFIMPSLYETFGLVYLEAMSQGLPVIYTKGQGFSGYYDDGVVGYAVAPKNKQEITKKIELIIRNYEEISGACIKEVENFTWNSIASKYLQLYNDVVKN